MLNFLQGDPIGCLRILCGLWFIPHLIGKLRNLGPAASTFEKAGFKPPALFIWLTIIAETLGATGLIFGIWVRPAAGLAVIVLLGAAYAMLKINGFNWRWQKLGVEYMLFWAIVCVISAITAPT